jgi:hypothetical protein
MTAARENAGAKEFKSWPKMRRKGTYNTSITPYGSGYWTKNAGDPPPLFKYGNQVGYQLPCSISRTIAARYER